MFRDFANNIADDQVVDPVVISADADGSSVDLKNYDGGVTFLALVGASGDELSGSVYVELEVEESADDSTFTDVADADLVGYVAGNNDGCFAVIDAPAEDDAVYKCHYRGNKRYVRPVINVTGTHTNGIPIGIVALRLGAKNKPVS